MLRIHELKLSVNEKESSIPGKLLKLLADKDIELSGWQITKRSLDARFRGRIKMVYTVDFTVKHKKSSGKPHRESRVLEEMLLQKSKGLRLERTPDHQYHYVEPGDRGLKTRPVIVGFGPCGIFTALILAEMGYRPIVLERGKAIHKRVADVQAFWQNGVLNEESNVQFGEGGAGTFSDGKLTTQIKDNRVHKVVKEFTEAGGGSELGNQQKPHIGTDVLQQVVVNLRNKIIENGGEIRFENKVTGLYMENGRLQAVQINDEKRLETEILVLAIGHSARDTFRMLDKAGMKMEQKPFSIGVRIEHRQAVINQAQYGDDWEDLDLGAADYKLSHHCTNGRGVYTFCMCPGGQVIAAASQAGGVVTNGMSHSSRSGENANSGLLVDVTTADYGSDDPLAGVDFQEKYERLAFQAGGCSYKAPAQRLGDFVALRNTSQVSDPECSPKPSYRPGVVWTDLAGCLPKFAVDAMREAIPVFGKKLSGFDGPDAVMTGVETRSSSPVRLLRGENMQSGIGGIYPAGEGAGYAGGIVSAAVDGIKIAEQIVRSCRPL